MGIGKALWCLTVVAAIAACHVSIGDDSADDPRASLKKAGTACTQSSECQSDNCLDDVCTGRACETTRGEADPSKCESGWSCIHHDATCAFDIFCSSAGFTCTATCGGGCPAGTYCPEGNTDPGTYCQYGTPPPPEPPAQPVVSISAQYWAHPNEQVPFTANVSPVAGVTISSTTWDFGDGATGNGAQATHAYAKVGTYSVKVTIVDSYNRSDNTDQTIGICVERGTECTTDVDCCDNPSVYCLSTGVCGSAF